MQAWTVKKLLDWSINYFKEKSVSQARLSSELLLGSALGFSRMQLYLNYNYAPTQEELDKFKKYILKRLQGVPIQYILKEANFRKIKLYVDENVLIPRPETELVVEKAVEVIGRLAKNRDKVEILEVGVGSGAISLSILFELKGLNYNILATDNSGEAINVAKKNAENILGKEELEGIKFSVCDILPEESSKFDLVISNPPYITVTDYKGLPKEVKDHEPRHALLAGETGKEVYGQIMDKAGLKINSGGYMIFEIDPGLAEDLRKLAGDRLPAKNISVYKDYNDRDRILSIEI